MIEKYHETDPLIDLISDDYRLPLIRRKLITAIDCSSNNQIAFLILKFYDEYAGEVASHMNYEHVTVHPHSSYVAQR